jgi:tRNA threonylcarbamoyladenosine modification (KEOPS) complex Cgi121 subunit
LLFLLPEFGSHVWISGFESRPENLDQILGATQEKFPAVSVQLVDLNKVAGSRYLLLAVFNALKSFQSKHPISRTLGMEILLYVAADRQIIEAPKKVGVTSSTRKTAALAVGSSTDLVSRVGDFLSELLNQKPRDELVDEWPAGRIANVRLAFDIGDKELNATIRKNGSVVEAIQRLVIERSAMLTIKK